MPKGRESHMDEDLEWAWNYVRRAIRWAIFSGIALFLSSSAVVPFLYGHSLHAHAEPFARYLIYLSEASLVVFVLCAAWAWNEWTYFRGLEKCKD